jgi:hypothetical protein
MRERTVVSRTLSFRLAQIWRDGALRSMPLWLVVTGLNTSVLVGALVFRAIRDSSEVSLTALATVLWLALAVFLGVCRGRARCSVLDLALPMSSRELWLGHLIATVLSGLLALGVSVGVIVAHEILIDREIGWQRVVGPLVAGLVLVAVSLQSYRRDLREPSRGRFNLVLLVALFAVLGVVVFLIDRPKLAVAIQLGSALGIGAWTFRALSPAFKIVPLKPQESSGRGASERTGGELATGRGATWRTLFAIFHHAPPWGAATPWVLYAFVTVVGFVMAGGIGLFSTFYDDRVLRFIYLPLASYALFTGIGVLLYQSFRVEPLPVSRDRLFTLLMLPTLVVFLVGFVSARLALEAAPEAQIVNYRIRGESYWVDVPVRYLSISNSGEVPTIEAPWGESHPAWRTPLLGTGDTVMYSMFNTDERSSARFEAFLVSRAVEALYGRTIPVDDILERYFVVENDRPVAVRGGNLTLLEDYPELAAPDDGPESPVYLALIVVPWLLFAAVFFRAFRAPASERRLKVAYWTIMGLLLAAVLAQAMGMILGLFDAEVASAILATWIRQLGESPVTIAVRWAVAVVSISAAYLVALHQYRRCEFPAQPIRLSLVDFAPGSS